MQLVNRSTGQRAAQDIGRSRAVTRRKTVKGLVFLPINGKIVLRRYSEDAEEKKPAFGGALMHAHTLSIALTLTMAPLPAIAFNEDEFCTTVTDIARRMHARAGRWLDRSTRHDGVEVDCGLKTLEAKRFLKADPDDMREGWEVRKQRDWNVTYCNNEGWREAIDDGWSVISTITFRTGETVSFVAEC
jgi:hypothetical protein